MTLRIGATSCSATGPLTTKYCHLQEVDAAGGEQVQNRDAIGVALTEHRPLISTLRWCAGRRGNGDPLNYLEHTGTDVL